MFGFFTALIKELATGETFTSQLSYNLTHGVSFAIIFLVTAGTLAPCVTYRPDARTPFEESRPQVPQEPRARVVRQYLYDPRAVADSEDSPGGTAARPWWPFAPLAGLERPRPRVGLIATFVIEGATKHGLFRG